MVITPKSIMQLDIGVYVSSTGSSTATDASTHRFYSVRLDSIRVWDFDTSQPGGLNVAFHSRLGDLQASGSYGAAYSLIGSGTGRDAMEVIPDGLNGSIFYGWNETNVLARITRSAATKDYGIVLVCSLR